MNYAKHFWAAEMPASSAEIYRLAGGHKATKLMTIVSSSTGANYDAMVELLAVAAQAVCDRLDQIAADQEDLVS